jgi:hypothetical protein
MNIDTVHKKRGRKPKNFIVAASIQDESTQDTSIKKKRGRKKKYEIENHEKIVNRDHINNFNHNIAYSEDSISSESETEDCVSTEPVSTDVKKVAFGNLDIIVSKRVAPVENGYRQKIIDKTKEYSINENEYSDEDEEIPIEEVLSLNQPTFEKYYKDHNKYNPDTSEKDKSLKRIRVVSCLKGTVQDNEWPDSCDTACWWCCHTFQNCPCTLPTRYDSHRKRFTFIGIFCSWNCAKAYNFSTPDNRKYERTGLISLLIQQLFSVREAVSIKPSPPRQCLKMFGGYMDIDEFRNNSMVDTFHLNLLQHKYIYPEVSEVTNVKVAQTDKKNLRLFRK